MVNDNNHGGTDKMPVPQKTNDTNFSDFITKKRDVINRIVKSNTQKNDAGLTIVPKDDPWREEEEWDAMYKDLKNK
ncbi:MAG: hypothetical protein ACYCV0_14470 [Desulfitobacteriaceae bacterium]